MKITLPVTWSVCGTVQVEADSVEDAVRVFNETSGDIKLPFQYEYVDGSFQLSTDDPGIIRDCYNKVSKIIFLDVDGVLNNGVWAEKMLKEEGVHVYCDDILEDRALRLLKLLVEQTGARIIVSSAWRQIPDSYLNLRASLASYGLKVSGETPYVGGIRGDDITAWFKRNPGVYKYVILDDDSDMGVHAEHLFQTNFYTGLTREIVDACIEHLNT